MNESRARGRKQIWKCVAFEGVGAGWYEDPVLLAACDEASALLGDDAKRVARLYARVAQRLNALPGNAFGTSEPPVVYAFDRNALPTSLLTASLPAKKRTALAREGLL